MTTELDFILRLVVACVLSGLVGLERERRDKSAGLRTHMLVGLASALFVIVAEIMVTDFAEYANVEFDPIRTVQAVATGVGFLGGGVIFVSRGKERVHGLTTAASIWATSSLGLVVGLGHILLALIVALLLLLVLRGAWYIETRSGWRAGGEEP